MSYTYERSLIKPAFAFCLSFLHERVPLLTPLALPHPFRMFGATVGTDKDASTFCHGDYFFLAKYRISMPITPVAMNIKLLPLWMMVA